MSPWPELVLRKHAGLNLLTFTRHPIGPLHFILAIGMMILHKRANTSASEGAGPIICDLMSLRSLLGRSYRNILDWKKQGFLFTRTRVCPSVKPLRLLRITYHRLALANAPATTS